MHPFTESTMARAQQLIVQGRAHLDEASAIWRRDDESIRLRNEAMGAAQWCFEQAQLELEKATQIEREVEAAE
jgi:hypothetical protein